MYCLIILLSIVCCLFQQVQCDLLRTVYCRDKCNDYLKVPETLMPICNQQHLKFQQCGTVISCSWDDVEIEKHRRVANETEEVTCCYSVQLKEKGDCDSQQQISTSTGSNKHQNNIKTRNGITSSAECLAQTPAIFSLLAILILIVAVQGLYIMWSCVFQKRIYHQKVAQNFEESAASQVPIFAARPICETRLLSFDNMVSP